MGETKELKKQKSKKRRKGRKIVLDVIVSGEGCKRRKEVSTNTLPTAEELVMTFRKKN
jgi:hypothetical protein